MKPTQRPTTFISDNQLRKKEVNQFLMRLSIERPDDATLTFHKEKHSAYTLTGQYMLLPAVQRCPLVFYGPTDEQRCMMNIMTGQVEFSGDLLEHRQGYLRRLLIIFDENSLGLRSLRENRIELEKLPSIVSKYGQESKLQTFIKEFKIDSQDERECYFKVCQRLYQKYGHERCLYEICKESAFVFSKERTSLKLDKNCFEEW